MKQTILKLGAAVTIAFVFIGCGSEEGKEKISQEVKELAWMDKGKTAVRSKLKDPNSAMFKEVFYSKSGGVPMTCGLVNSKNSFGGYGGYQRFVSAGKYDLTYLEEQVKDFAKVWDKFCR